MGLVFDTNIFINIENGKLDIDQLPHLLESDDTYIAAITASELLAGVYMAKTVGGRIQRSAFVENIIAKIPILEFTEEVARVYATLYAHFLKPRSKSRINVHDLQIAATAIAHGFVVITSNLSDFKKVPGLKVKAP